MTKTLANAADLEQIRLRIASLMPNSQRQWGEMSVGGMLCHLDDSYQLALGEKLVARVKLPLPLPLGQLDIWRYAPRCLGQRA